MRRGFSLVELIFALLLFQVGVLATVGMFFLAQRNLRRAESTLRGVLEAGWVSDSLTKAGEMDSGGIPRPWGNLVWSPVSAPLPGLRVAAWFPLEADTLAAAWAFPSSEMEISPWPDVTASNGGQ